MQESTNRRIMVQPCPGIKQDPISKTIKAKGIVVWLKW
jgi:hypothetical protein